VKSYYQVLTSSNVDFPWKSNWRVKAPSKVVFFFFVDSGIIGIRENIDIG
jgi:hypothetical protein